MNEEIKKQWIEALTNGDYKQGQKRLRATHGPSNVCYCCLGVLCDLYSKATNTPWIYDIILGHNAVLPLEVQAWSGLKAYGPGVEFPDGDSLMALNDNQGMSFEQIAAVITEKL
jgi:hypothetical protein